MTIFKEHPRAFYQDILTYGQTFAKRVLDGQDFAAFDPMLSDRSCQLRAVWLACFGRIKRRAEGLEEEEVLIFGLARFLCESAIPAQHPTIGTVPLRTASAYWPEGLFRLKNAVVRRRFFGQAKALLAEGILGDMEMWLRGVKPEDIVLGAFVPHETKLLKKAYAELLTMFRQPVYSVYSEMAIPVVPFLPGFIAVATLAASFGVPLAVIFRKVCRDRRGKGRLICKERLVNAFMFDQSKGRFDETSPPQEENTEAKPVVVFSGHSYLGDRSGDIARGSSILRFLNRTCDRDLSIMDYVYAIMATHAAMPGERHEGDWKIAKAPFLSWMTQNYLTLAQQTGLSVHETVKNVFNAARPNAEHELVIDRTPYEVTHVCNASWEQLGIDKKKRVIRGARRSKQEDAAKM